MKLSILIPCFNEKNTIKQIVQAVLNAPIQDKEIIIIEDASTDGSRELIKEQIESMVDLVIYNQNNCGKGAAIRSGLLKATGDVIAIQDADLEYNPNDLSRMLDIITNTNAEIVYGSRFLDNTTSKRVYFWSKLANRIITFFFNLCAHMKITDVGTCYKMFKREVIFSINIVENRFGFDPEITMKLAKKKHHIHEIPISYNGRNYKEGKKIYIKDGFRALYIILKYKLIN